MLFSAEEPDRLRGKQHMKLWCDELAAWRQPDAFDQAMLGLRLGDKPQAIITTTPRPSKIIKTLAAGKDTIVTRGSTFDNKAHLARAFFERITARYKGRAIGQQELFAEIVEETPGALWSRALLERQRVAPEAAPKEFAEIVVAVDPPARSGSKSDECGLIVAAKAENGLFYVLADLTSQGETPGAWGARVGAAFRNFKANRVVAEINQGGDMVTEVLRQSEPNLPVRAVHATRGKFLRAEPIAAAYERGLVFHVGTFGKLEDQLCALTPDFDRRAMGFSPDRADALVWALADLLGRGTGEPGGDVRVLDGRRSRTLRMKRRSSVFVRSPPGESRLQNMKLLDIASNDAYLLVRRREMPAAIVEARQAELSAIGPQTFADERDRARLSEVALKAFLALMKAWDLSERGGRRASRGFAKHARPHEARLPADLEPGPADAGLRFGWRLQGTSPSVCRRDGGRMGATAQ